MEIVNGYQRAAAALAPLDATERDWFLRQLDEDDRRRIDALLREADDTHAVETPAPSATPAGSDDAGDDDVGTLEVAHGDTLSVVLHEQPDWVVALVLANCRKNMALRRYVDALPQPRCGRIHGLVKEMEESIKPNVRAAVLRRVAIAARRASMENRPANFDSMVMNFTPR